MYTGCGWGFVWCVWGGSLILCPYPSKHEDVSPCLPPSTPMHLSLNQCNRPSHSICCTRIPKLGSKLCISNLSGMVVRVVVFFFFFSFLFLFFFLSFFFFFRFNCSVFVCFVFVCLLVSLFVCFCLFVFNTVVYRPCPPLTFQVDIGWGIHSNPVHYMSVTRS